MRNKPFENSDSKYYIIWKQDLPAYLKVCRIRYFIFDKNDMSEKTAKLLVEEVFGDKCLACRKVSDETIRYENLLNAIHPYYFFQNESKQLGFKPFVKKISKDLLKKYLEAWNDNDHEPTQEALDRIQRLYDKIKTDEGELPLPKGRSFL